MGAARTLPAGDGYSHAIGIFGRRWISGIELAQDVAAHAMQERVTPLFGGPHGQSQPLINLRKRSVEVLRCCFKVREEPVVKRQREAVAEAHE